MITFRVDDTQLRRKSNTLLREMGRTSHPKHPLVRLDAWIKRELGAAWRSANVTRPSRVGTETWAAFRPPPDPPWGGRPKVRGSGTTLGRKRPSGRRLTPNSRQMIDTWALYRSVIMQPPDIVRNVLRIGRKAQTLRYGRKQLSMRKLSFPAGAQAMYIKFAKEWLVGHLAHQWNSTGRRVFGGSVRRSDVA